MLGILDLFVKELEAFQCRSAGSWEEIISQVRADLWETATGEELFRFTHFWSQIREVVMPQIEEDKYIASIARTTPGNIADMKVSDVYALPRRPVEERMPFYAGFVADLTDQLGQHGDKELKDAHVAAVDFMRGTLRQI